MTVRTIHRVLSGKNRKEPVVVDERQRWCVLKCSNQARSEGGLGIITEALNFERRSFPRIGVGHLRGVRKEWENGVS